MKSIHWIILLAAIGGLIFLMRKKISSVMTRGYKNNNPGNIRFDGETWQGEIKSDDPDFKAFKDIKWGYRAMFINLRSYFGIGVDTVEKIIYRYAPPEENDTEAYIRSVCEFTGFDRSEKIDTESEETNLVAALSYHENGITPNLTDVVAGHKLV